MIGQACPFCHSTNVDAEFVDIGVGFERVTPYHCTDCLAHEFFCASDSLSADAEEQAVGWFKGPYLSGMAGEVFPLPAG